MAGPADDERVNNEPRLAQLVDNSLQLYYARPLGGNRSDMSDVQMGNPEGNTPNDIPTRSPEERGTSSMATIPDPDSPTAWMADGLCRMYPPATFFPSDGVGVEKARRICAGCPVQNECLEHALEHRIEHGVWGGCSERERRRILKRRRLASAAETN